MMTRRMRVGLVIGLAALAVLMAAALPPIPQDPAYHRMADTRTLLGIPHALNVVSNVAFVVVGITGLRAVGRGGPSADGFLEERERWPWMVFFAGLVLTGLGSVYYHLDPGNGRLVWDRLPLAITLMALFAGIIAERIGVTVGLALLGPLVALGIASVLVWHATELAGRGDLRLYGIVQFYPMLAIPLLLVLFPPRYSGARDLVVMVALYGVAKIFEVLDGHILAAGGLVSGHTLKHLTAALSGYWIVRMLATRQPTATTQWRYS
jgi:hypothetical protein